VRCNLRRISSRAGGWYSLKNPMQAMRRSPSSASAISALPPLRCMAYDLFTRKPVHVAYTRSTVAFLLFVFGAIFGGMVRSGLAIAP
jgi:hypothetical protein